MQGMRIKGGVSLFGKEIPLPYTHPEKIYIAGFRLEGLHALRSVGAVYVAAPRVFCVSLPLSTAPYSVGRE